MSETDVQAEAVEPEDEFADLKYPGDEAPSTPAPEAEPEEAEEASEEAGETEETPPPVEDGDPQASELLKEIPEEHRDLAMRYADRRRAGLQQSWQGKLDEAAEARKKAEIHDKWAEQLKENPRALAENILAEAKNLGFLKDQEDTPPPPEDPGTMPLDEFGDVDVKALPEWQARKDAYAEYKVEQALAAKEEEWQKRINPVLEQDQRRQQMEAMNRIRVATKAETDDEFRAILEEGEVVRQGGPEAGFKTIAELHRLRKEVAALKAGKATKVARKLAGSEEKAGLPSTGATKARPVPTGDFLADLAAELEADGIEFPEGA